jgi:hypothetical protein
LRPKKTPERISTTAPMVFAEIVSPKNNIPNNIPNMGIIKAT